MINEVFVVESLSHLDGEREVIAVFSSEDKAMDYIYYQLEDEELIEIFGKFDYSVSQHCIDGRGRKIRGKNSQYVKDYLDKISKE